MARDRTPHGFARGVRDVSIFRSRCAYRIYESSSRVTIRHFSPVAQLNSLTRTCLMRFLKQLRAVAGERKQLVAVSNFYSTIRKRKGEKGDAELEAFRDIESYVHITFSSRRRPIIAPTPG